MTTRLTTDHRQSGLHNSAAQSDRHSQRFHQRRTEILTGQLKRNQSMLQVHAIKEHGHMRDQVINTKARKSYQQMHLLS